MTGWIYAVHDSAGAVVYVGQTGDSLASRWRGHLSAAENDPSAPFSAWLAMMLELGSIPAVSVLEQPAVEDLNERESFWIAEHARARGSALLNVKSRPPTPPSSPPACSRCFRRLTAARTKTGMCRRCYPRAVHSADTRALSGLAIKAHWDSLTPELRAVRTLGNLGKTAEERAAVAQLGALASNASVTPERKLQQFEAALASRRANYAARAADEGWRSGAYIFTMREVL